MPFGGFIFGVREAQGTSSFFSETIGRLFIGIVFAILTPIFGGYPPQNEGGVGPPFNVWPDIILGAVIIFLVTFPVILWLQCKLLHIIRTQNK